MKKCVQLYMDGDVFEAVKTLASDVGVPIGDLHAVLLQYGLERLSRDRLKEWAKSQPERRGRPAGGLRVNDRAVLDAMDRLWARVKQDLTFRFDTADIAHEAGLRVAVAQDALSKLAGVGFVKWLAEPGPDGQPPQDRWGRIAKAIWWKPEHSAEADVLRVQRA